MFEKILIAKLLITERGDQLALASAADKLNCTMVESKKNRVAVSHKAIETRREYV